MSNDSEKEKPADIMNKLKELEASLAKELDQKVRLAEPTDPRLEGTVAVNPNMGKPLQAPVEPEAPVQELQKTQEQTQEVAPTEKTVESIIKSQVSNPPPEAAGQSAAGDQTSTKGRPGAEKKIDEITLKDVDDILDQIDSGFRSSLVDIKSEISKIGVLPNMESIAIGSDFLQSDDDGKGVVQTLSPVEDVPEAAPTSTLLDDIGDMPPLGVIVKALGRATGMIPVRFINALAKELPSIRINPREALLHVVKTEIDDLRAWSRLFKKFITRLLSYSAKSYILTAVLFALIFVTFYLFNDVYNNFRPDREKDPFLRNFNDVADSVQVIPNETDGEDLESPLRHPEYMVLVHRMSTNLAAPNKWSSPMVVAEFYIEASNQDCAIEIHDREAEVRDIIERILEQTSFDDLETNTGKARLKVQIRKGLNRILNKGSAKRVMFRTLNLKK